MNTSNYTNEFAHSVNRPSNRKVAVAEWILANRASRVSGPTEAGLRKFAEGRLNTDIVGRIPHRRRQALTQTVHQVINEFEAEAPR
jgi:hypothetical protein